ncbi:hypothetical protein [Fulvimonas yonginensis]|uniref:Uncharacterized protein n=1 Tax=Fulvimonas yonginensis TaxID=1495200 RepID=A0ABU8JBP3_9GAMM
MTPFEKDVDALVRRLRSERAEVEQTARRLTGAERSAAVAHGNVKEAVANELRRLMWKHGLGEQPAEKPKR